jgi:hypothetical protein
MMSFHRSAQGAPRRAPVVMATQSIAPQSG